MLAGLIRSLKFGSKARKAADKFWVHNVHTKSGGRSCSSDPRSNERLIIRQGGSMRITSTPLLADTVNVQNAR